MAKLVAKPIIILLVVTFGTTGSVRTIGKIRKGLLVILKATTNRSGHLEESNV